MLTTTQLFVELLVIGIGPVLWVTMFLAAVLGYRLDKEIPRLDALSLLVVGGVAYALGTGVDRLARAVLTPVEKWHSANIKTGSFDAEVMERQILVSSEPLGRQIQYNRSRLRICRAWALNAFLILLAFIAWNMRVKVIRLGPCLIVAGIGFLVCVLMAWAALALLKDHYKNIRDSYKVLFGPSFSTQPPPPVQSSQSFEP